MARRNLVATIRSQKDFMETIRAIGVLEAFFERRNLKIRTKAQTMEADEDTTIIHCPTDSVMVG